MFRPASRFLIQRSLKSPSSWRPSSRRLLNTAPPAKTSRTWKNSALRWGLAVAGVYYYGTSNAFAEEPIVARHPETPENSASLQTLDSIAAERRQRKLASLGSGDEQSPVAANGTSIIDGIEDAQNDAPPQTAQEYEDEAGQQGAFNPETGEINWDCPCLGGMAHGPCGEEFKKAFSCFVYSKVEPKGMDCIEHFKTMQGCFRKHPDEYGGELDEDEDSQDQESTPDLESTEPGMVSTLPHVSSQSPNAPPSPSRSQSTSAWASLSSEEEQVPSNANADNADAMKERVKESSDQVRTQHPPSDELVPKAAHDARPQNEG